MPTPQAANLIARMIDRATEAEATEAPPQPTLVQGRFARDPSEFTIIKEAGG